MCFSKRRVAHPEHEETGARGQRESRVFLKAVLRRQLGVVVLVLEVDTHFLWPEVTRRRLYGPYNFLEL